MVAPTVPEGYQSLTPFLTVDDVEAAVRFYTEVFNARTAIRREEHGRLLLADLLIGESHLVLSGSEGASPPATSGALTLRAYVPSADAVFARALKAGATQVSAPEDMFWGDRVAEVTDPFGLRWKISQHLEDLAHREIERRMHAARA